MKNIADNNLKCLHNHNLYKFNPYDYTYDCRDCRSSTFHMYTLDIKLNKLIAYFIYEKNTSIYSEINKNYTEIVINHSKIKFDSFFDFDYMNPNKYYNQIINKVRKLKSFI